MSAKDFVRQIAAALDASTKSDFGTATNLYRVLKSTGQDPIHYQTLYSWLAGRRGRPYGMQRLWEFARRAATTDGARGRIDEIGRSAGLSIPEMDPATTAAASALAAPVSAACALLGFSLTTAKGGAPFAIELAELPEAVPCELRSGPVESRAPLTFKVNDAADLVRAAEPQRLLLQTACIAGDVLERATPWTQDGAADRLLLEYDRGIDLVLEQGTGGGEFALRGLAARELRTFVATPLRGRWPVLVDADILARATLEDSLLCWPSQLTGRPSWRTLRAVGATGGLLLLVVNAWPETGPLLRLLADAVADGTRVIVSCKAQHARSLRRSLESHGLARPDGAAADETVAEAMGQAVVSQLLGECGWSRQKGGTLRHLGDVRSGAITVPAVALALATRPELMNLEPDVLVAEVDRIVSGLDLSPAEEDRWRSDHAPPDDADLVWMNQQDLTRRHGASES